MLRSLILPIVLASLMSLVGCIGSTQRRNPNIQRRDILPVTSKSQKSLISARRKTFYYEPSRIEMLVRELPANSWSEHDLDLYSTLGKDEAASYAPVYPWFEVPELSKKPVAGARN
jgi:hypothetical protein